MAQISVTLSEVEGHFCSYDWQSTSCIPVHLQSFLLYQTVSLSWELCI